MPASIQQKIYAYDKENDTRAPVVQIQKQDTADGRSVFEEEPSHILGKEVEQYRNSANEMKSRLTDR